MAEKRIKGITIEIGGDTKKLSEALKDVNKTINSTNTELKDLQKALKLDPKNTELLSQKQELLEKQIKATKERLDTLKESQKQMGDYNSIPEEQKENYRALSVEIARAESNLKDLNNELKSGQKFNLNSLNDSLSGIRDKTTQLVKDFAKFGVALGGTLTALGISSIKSYAEYEQLVGGVETLFKDSSEEIKKYSQEAYKTAGLSSNEYMATVTSFSASLIQSLEGDTRKAVKYSDMAITDMSDNANKMGTNIESLQNAYQAFAKGQFQLLDNLKLGYGGTKTEMERLIADANKVKLANGEMANLSINSFADMVEAIHTIQNEMGITGTTSKEADSTILGSVNSMKASWNNLLVAVSDDNADMGKAVNNFVDGVITAGKNIVPRIRIAIDGIKQLFNSLVRDVFPKLKREIPEIAPIINIFEWLIEHKGLILTAIKGIIGAFVVTKIVEFTKKVNDAVNSLLKFAQGGIVNQVVLGITAIVGVAKTLISIFNQETEAEKKARIEMEKHSESLNNHVDRWNELTSAQQEQINKGMTELSYYENLYKELQAITDQNGKVQEGYEKRAEFIVSQLSEAFGIEIDYQDGIIKNNQEIAESIQKVLEKKRAEVILNAQSQAYGEAKAKETEALQNFMYWEQKYEEEHSAMIKAYNDGNDLLYFSLKGRLEDTQKEYDKAKDVYYNYQYTIAQYEQNLVYAHQEAYDKIDTRTWKSVKNYQNASDTQKATLEGDIELTERKLDELEKAYENTGNDIFKVQIDNTKRILAEQQEELKKYISAISEQKPNIKTAFENFIEGGIQGLNSKKSSLFSTITNIGNTMLSKLKLSLKEQSPSKATREMGEYLIEGLSLGIKDNQNALLNQVDSLGNSVISGLYDDTMNAMKGLNNSVSTSLNPTINPSVAYDLNYKLMANAMKEALQDVDVELDDRKIGKFIDKSVSEEVFS